MSATAVFTSHVSATAVFTSARLSARLRRAFTAKYVNSIYYIRKSRSLIGWAVGEQVQTHGSPYVRIRAHGCTIRLNARIPHVWPTRLNLEAVISVGIPNGTWYLGFPFLGVYLRYKDGMQTSTFRFRVWIAEQWTLKGPKIPSHPKSQCTTLLIIESLRTHQIAWARCARPTVCCLWSAPSLETQMIHHEAMYRCVDVYHIY